MGSQTIGSITSAHACESLAAINIYPVRYTVAAKQKTDAAYAYPPSDLERKFPKLDSAQYVLRPLREGFLYIWDDTRKNHLIYEVSKHGFKAMQMDTPQDIKHYECRGSEISTIPIFTDSTVYLCYSDTLLTTERLIDIEHDRSNIRDKMSKVVGADIIAKTFNGDCVDPKSTSAKIKDLKPHNVCNLTNTLNLAAHSVIVAMHDNIGLVQEQTNLINTARTSLHEYISKAKTKENENVIARRRLASKIIDGLYEQDKKKFSNRLEKHLDLAAKEKFDKEYRLSVLKYQVALRRLKSDRCKWLKTYNSIPVPPDSASITYDSTTVRSKLRSAFSFYDTKHPFSAIAHAEAFCSCIDGMMSDPEIKTAITKENYKCHRMFKKTTTIKADGFNLYQDVTTTSLKREEVSALDDGWQEDESEYLDDLSHDPEKQLFHDWWQASPERNPILCNLDYDAPDSKKKYSNTVVLSSMTKVQHANYKKSNKRKAVLAKAAKDLTTKLYSRLGKSLATKHIVHEILGLALKNHQPNANLMKAGDSAHTIIQKRLHIPTKINTDAFFKTLFRAYSSDPEFKIGQLKRTEAVAKMFDFAGLGSTRQKVYLKSINPNASQFVDHIHYSQETRFSLEKHPFGHKAAASVTALNAILMFVNLGQALDAIDLEKCEVHALTNLASALCGVIAGVHASVTFAKRVVKVDGMLLATQASASRSTLVKFGVGRAFGVLSAVFDSVTNMIKAHKAFKAGDDDAGSFYAGAALCLGAGGVTLALFGSVGALVFGPFLLLLGIWFLFEAHKATDTPIEKWLNACIFGTHSRGRRLESAEIEFREYINALYRPIIQSYDWQGPEKRKDKSYEQERLLITIVIPIKDKLFRLGVKRGTSIPTVSTEIDENSGYQWTQGREYKRDEFRVSYPEVKNHNSGLKITCQVSNVRKRYITESRELDIFTFIIKYMPHHSEIDQWLTLGFTVTRKNWVEGLAGQSIDFFDFK